MSDKWRYGVLKKQRVLEIIKEYRANLRVELTKGCDPAFHLESDEQTFGRMNAGLARTWIAKGVLIPMEKQRGFINVFDYKFSEHATKAVLGNQ